MAGDEPMTEYEKKRMLRIRENEARLEALGLRSLAADPLLRNPYPSAAAKRKQKGRYADEDEEYVPSDEGGGEDEEEEEGTSSESGQDDEVDGRSKSSSRSHAKGKKKKLLNSSKSYKNATKVSSSFSDFVDDDTALQQAIALSLAASSERSVGTAAAETSSAGLEGGEGTPQKKKSKASNLDFTKKGKNKNVKSRIQLTEDDVVAFFFSFDEVGKGYITPWDLERMATVNDFIWTDSEISNMIRCFDSDGDGKEPEKCG